MDMQKDTIVHSVTSVMLDPTNSNIPVTIDDITSVAVNGRDLGFDGYLDIGLYDTMADLFVNFIGAVVFSTIGYFYIKHRGRGKIARAFIPTIAGEASPSPEPRKRRMLPGNKPHSKVGGAELPQHKTPSAAAEGVLSLYCTKYTSSCAHSMVTMGITMGLRLVCLNR